MKDKDKTKEQLTNELGDFRKRIAELEKLTAKLKLTEEQLKESEEKYKDIVELAPDGIVTTDLKGVITSCNAALIKRTGFSRDEFINKHFSKIPPVRARDIPKYAKAISSLIRGKAPKPFEYEWIDKDGNTHVGEVYFSVMKKRGKKVGFQAITRDITERKRMEEQLQKALVDGAIAEEAEAAKKKLEDILEGAIDPIVVTDLKGKIIYANTATEKAIGIKKKKLIGQLPTNFIQKKYVPKFMNDLKTCIKKGFVRDSEYVGITGYIVSINLTLLKDLKGKPTGIITITRDITELRKAQKEAQKAAIIEAAAKEAEAGRKKLETYIESISDGIVISDLKGKTLDINKACLELLGYLGYNEKKEVIGTSGIIQSIPKRDIPKINALLREIIRKGSVRDREIVILTKDKKEIPILFSANVIKENGKPTNIISTFKDITERKQAEEEKERLQEQLVHSEKMAGIGTLTSGIAHEFNNMLQIMRGHTEFAQKTKRPEDMKDALDIVLNTSDRVTKIIRDLLTFSREEAPEKELCDIKEPIDSVLSLIEEHIEKNNIDVVRKYRRTPQIEINKGEIEQVFLNIVTNARDAMIPRGGKMEIRAKLAKENVEVSISDTGKGIKEKDLGKVFEPFYTTKGAVGKSETIAGTGLGLSVSYGIVKRHGGTIEVESEKGKGTTFTVKLPLK